MIDLNSLAEEVIRNRVRRNFADAYSFNAEALRTLMEELGEVSKAWRNRDKPEMIHELTDLAVATLGSLSLLTPDVESCLKDIVAKNWLRNS
jgi:NTP pyrophosphatase (non-canonical NTP hydrolase)